MYYLIDNNNELWKKSKSKIIIEWAKAGFELLKKYKLKIVKEKSNFKKLSKEKIKELKNASKTSNFIFAVLNYKEV